VVASRQKVKGEGGRALASYKRPDALTPTLLLPWKPSRGSPATAWTTMCSRPSRRGDGPSPKQPYRWDIGKELGTLVSSLGIADFCIHDLRHTGPSVLLMQGIPGDVVKKITGHRSRELERYQAPAPGVQGPDVDLIAQVLFSGRHVSCVFGAIV
jgi:integrase